MAVTLVTTWVVRCDCCDRQHENNHNTIFATMQDAIDGCIERDPGEAGWKEVDGLLLCEDCWVDEQDMPGYEGEGHNTDYIPFRRHEFHGGPAIRWNAHCQHAHPKTGAACIVEGPHQIHSASIEYGPDWP